MPVSSRCKALLLTLFIGAAASSEEPPASEPTSPPAQAGNSNPETKSHGFDALGVPLLSFNSDTGFGFGAAGGAFFYSPGYSPFRASVSAQVFFTTLGQQNHFIQLDLPKLFLGLRVESRIEYRRDLFSPYYGVGNFAAPGANYDTQLRRFGYDRTRPAAFVRFRGKPLGDKKPLQTYVGLRAQANSIQTYPGSLLSEQQSRGIHGGWNNQLQVGALWDTRDDENVTTRGGMEELAYRVSGDATGSTFRYYGFHFTERRFAPIGRRVVLAERVTGDALFGQVPFFDWNAFGGISDAEGIGGISSTRGVPLDRYGGNYKVFSNTEVRVHVWDFEFLKQTINVGVLALFDFGRVWQPRVDNGPWSAFHGGAGAGLRLTRREAVVRFDYAVDTDDGRQAFYVAFGQMF